MKRHLLPLLLLTGCAVNNPEPLPEDELFITRKYAGQFISCELQGKTKFGDAPVMLVRTTSDEYEEIKVYTKECEFVPGERIYLNRVRTHGYWVFLLESASVHYRICEFAFDDKLVTQVWY